MQNRVVVYRIEHKKTGLGPYQSLGSNAWTGSNHSKLSRTPAPYDIASKANLDDNRWKFGFSTMKGLHRWFSKSEIESLKEYNYIIKSFKVDKSNIIKGKGQLIFKVK